MGTRKDFTFEISLSVLDHLGRNLYRSFTTVLGEAISNSWDADANNVWIYIDRKSNDLIIIDDGIGMSADDFQNKFLKIGYSKRKGGEINSPNGRPFIGRKGIGKLALLSCARKVHILSKKINGDYIGGIIDNSGLDQAITDDLTPQEYLLGKTNQSLLEPFANKSQSGTIIFFEDIKEGIKHSIEYLRKIIALYFRFSLLDDSFSIFFNDEIITLDDLHSLFEKTEYVWTINDLHDPHLLEKMLKIKEPQKNLTTPNTISGFIASVEKPQDLKAIGTDERASVDLFVNGRLREKDILKHIPTARLAENYFYGQIHFNGLDDEKDRFTSSREGIIANDKKFNNFLEDLLGVIRIILHDWDEWRRKHKKTGDPENNEITKKKRASIDLFNAVSIEYDPPVTSKNKDLVEGWVNSLQEDAIFNFESYAECFISENLIRMYIREKSKPLNSHSRSEVSNMKRKESVSKRKGNVNIKIRQNADDLSYLDMECLAECADNTGDQNNLRSDAKSYKPIRDAVAHTALLTDKAKRKLSTVFDNIEERVRTILFDSNL